VNIFLNKKITQSRFLLLTKDN